MSLKKNLGLAILLFACCRFAQAQDLKTIEQNRVKLPNGWSLTPVGKSLPLGDLPLNIAVSKNHHYAAVTIMVRAFKLSSCWMPGQTASWTRY